MLLKLVLWYPLTENIVICSSVAKKLPEYKFFRQNFSAHKLMEEDHEELNF